MKTKILVAMCLLSLGSVAAYADFGNMNESNDSGANISGSAPAAINDVSTSGNSAFGSMSGTNNSSQSDSSSSNDSSSSSDSSSQTDNNNTADTATGDDDY